MLRISVLPLLYYLLWSLSCWNGSSTEARSWDIPNICLQPPPRSEGICTIEIEGFYFDLKTNNCEQYTVGGCRLTGGQSFGSQQDCLATCVHGTRRLQNIRYE